MQTTSSLILAFIFCPARAEEREERVSRLLGSKNKRPYVSAGSDDDSRQQTNNVVCERRQLHGNGSMRLRPTRFRPQQPSGYYFPTARTDVLVLSGPAIPVIGDVLSHAVAPIIRARLRAFPAMTMLVTFSEGARRNAQLRPKQQASIVLTNLQQRWLPSLRPAVASLVRLCWYGGPRARLPATCQISQDSHELAFRRSSGSNGR